MACISQFCCMKIRVISRFYFTISPGQNFTVFTKNRKNLSTRNLPFIFQFWNSAEWKTFFSIKPDEILNSFIFISFYNTTRFKISSMLFDFDTLRTRCHFPFCLEMFPLHNSERSNFPSAKITLKSPPPLVQCKVFWLCPHSVLIQTWWMNLSW